jgi:endonuclease/exonuclease/phosphatase family metal-dependent hydrolase
LTSAFHFTHIQPCGPQVGHHTGRRATLKVRRCQVVMENPPVGASRMPRQSNSLSGILDGAQRVLLCGDLNSLARRDERGMGYAGLSGRTGLERYSEGASVSFAVLDMFARAGFTDNRGTGEQHTVPTALRRAHEKGAALRLDYALSRNVAVTNVEVLRSAPFDLLSDHFPLLLELRR